MNLYSCTCGLFLTGVVLTAIVQEVLECPVHGLFAESCFTLHIEPGTIDVTPLGGTSLVSETRPGTVVNPANF